jgi:hypothetical protein
MTHRRQGYHCEYDLPPENCFEFGQHVNCFTSIGLGQ